MSAQAFLALSRILTGVDALSLTLAHQYFDRLSSSPHEPQLREMLVRFEQLQQGPTLASQVLSTIVADATLRPTVCQVILLWYTSTMQDNLGAAPPATPAMRFGTPDEYFSGLVWPIIGAHVPGLSGGYFGHWRYRPDNEPGGNG
jgi:hypothetical protein